MFKPSEKKFRAKRIDIENVWEYFSLLQIANLRDMAQYYGNWTQFTGLKDSKGNEIYEGDILTNVGEYQQKFVVYEKEAAYCLFSTLGHWGSLNTLLNLEPRFSKNIQVIGNIFDNPNLL